MAQAFYQNLYTSEGASEMDMILDGIPSFVNPEMNEMLTATFSDQEITKALFQMGPTKSPGPDGLPALFYQRTGPLFKVKFAMQCVSFWREGTAPQILTTWFWF
jgi:hypothetical protein